MTSTKMLAAALGTTILSWGLAAPAARAGDDGNYSRVATIQVPGNPLTSFDISWVDQRTQTYFLSDRANKAVDIFDAAHGTYTGRVAGFVGINTALGAAANNTAGPNGVLTVGQHEIWAGDGDSTVKVINRDSMTITDTMSTGGQDRADEMAYDPQDHIFLVVNDAEDVTSDPNSGPFMTLISTEPGHKILAKIVIHYATNGMEQPVWDRSQGVFFVALPQNGANVADGDILKVDPHSLSLTGSYPVENCQPHGLVLGPRHSLYLGCNAVTPAPIQIVMDTRNGNIISTVSGTGGTDEAWYDPNTQNYFSGNSSFPGGAVLGIVDARTNTLRQNIPTTTSAHSVAADSLNEHVFVPFTPTASDAACTNGCISVYAPQELHNWSLADLRSVLQQLEN